ncbi:MAG: phosphotransferase, partial [Casimicrobiaceae bacterium]
REKLPKGAIHGDLFRDNVLFDAAAVAGIIDFGFAATDYFAYDLAIAVNDWCSDAEGALRDDEVATFVNAYERVRPLTAQEREQWPSLLRAAALRFWLSRLYDLHLPRGGVLTHAHDPAQFERVLRQRAARPARLPPSPAKSASGVQR